MVEILSGEMLFFLYIALFGISGIVCLASLHGISRVEDPETRWGIGTLLGLTGAWALAQVGYLGVTEPRLQYGFFVTGLVFGIAAVGPWVYFCSAFSGRSLHRNKTVRTGAALGFIVIALVKVTNPIHGQYFTAVSATEPFVHLAIHHQPLHWIVMGLAYALALVGFFMLFELFVEVDTDTKPLFAVVGLTGVPVIFDFVGATTPYLLDVTHSPIGVAAFAVGFLYVYFERFQTVELTGDTDNPILLLDGDGRVREWNRAAESILPALDEGERKRLHAIDPSLAEAADGPSEIIPLDRFGTTRYYRVNTNPFSADSARIGSMITLTDVTEGEHYRRRIERQNTQLEEFASIVSHDLRNPLTVAQGRLDMIQESSEAGHVEAVATAHERMETLIEDLLALARSGLQIDKMETVALDEFARDCAEMVMIPDENLAVEFENGTSIQADPERLRQLFENLYRNAIEHGGQDITISVGPLAELNGFVIEDNGGGIPDEIRDEVFSPGFTTQDNGTGFGLAIVAEIVHAHGWEITATESPDGGARFEITGVDGVGEPDS